MKIKPIPVDGLVAGFACSERMHLFARPRGARCVCGRFNWEEAAVFHAANMTPDDYASLAATAAGRMDSGDGLTEAIVFEPTKES